MNIQRILFPLLLAGMGLSPVMTQAGPAPYYLWMSQVDGSRVCAQTHLGTGWTRMGGPYSDSHCRKPL